MQFLRGLLEAESYLQNNLDEYVNVMDKKVAIIEKAGLLQSMPIVSPFKKQTGIYVSTRFLDDTGSLSCLELNWHRILDISSRGRNDTNNC